MGYATIKRDDYSETNFQMCDKFSREVDFTAIVFDEAGNGINYQRVSIPADLCGLQDLYAQFKDRTFKYSSEDQSNYGDKLDEPHAFQLIVRDGVGTALGFIGASETIFPDCLFIYELLVDHKAQAHGLGKSLVEKAIIFAHEEGLKGIYTETEIWNLPAQAFYEKCGFVEIDNLYWTGGPTYRIDF